MRLYTNPQLQVDENSIAHNAGLVLGQRIVGVNGTLIYPDTPHPVCEIVINIHYNIIKT